MDSAPQSSDPQTPDSQNSGSRSLVHAGIGITALLVVVALGITTVTRMGPGSSSTRQTGTSNVQTQSQTQGPSVQQVPSGNGGVQLPGMGDIPMPFLPQGSNLAGDLLQIGTMAGIPVWQVTFPDPLDIEQVGQDKIYVVVVPNRDDVDTVPFGLAMTKGDDAVIGDLHYTNFYGYKYSVNAQYEKDHRNDADFNTRFQDSFMASQKAWDEDPAHGNFLAQFEASKGITFHPVDGSVGTITLEKGRLYVLIANDVLDENINIDAPAVCGDSIPSHSEECDDGNAISGDGCSDTCLAEICGNSRVDYGEQCDDGNVVNGDGCSSTCQTEAICGNEVTEPPEECDDGKHCADLLTPCTSSADCAAIAGGDTSCAPRNNFSCSATCTSQNTCGDATVDPWEECDDGNLVNGDGCENDCTFTPGPFF